MSELGSTSLTVGLTGFSSVSSVYVDDVDDDVDTIEDDVATELEDTVLDVVRCLLLEMVTVTVGALDA